MARSNQFRWQAPGNGRLFDSSLKEWKSSKMSQRCIGVLQFLDENPSILKEFIIAIINSYSKNRGVSPIRLEMIWDSLDMDKTSLKHLKSRFYE